MSATFTSLLLRLADPRLIFIASGTATLLATGLGGNHELLKEMGAIGPQIGAELVTSVIEGRRDTDMGKVINKTGVQPW